MGAIPFRLFISISNVFVHIFSYRRLIYFCSYLCRILSSMKKNHTSVSHKGWSHSWDQDKWSSNHHRFTVPFTYPPPVPPISTPVYLIYAFSFIVHTLIYLYSWKIYSTFYALEFYINDFCSRWSNTLKQTKQKTKTKYFRQKFTWHWTRQQKRATPERWERADWLTLREFPDFDAGLGRLRWLREDPLSWTDGAENLGRPKWLEFSGQSPREEQAAQKKNPRHLQKAPLRIQQKSPDLCACVRPEQESSESIRCTHTGPGRVSVPTTQREKPLNSLEAECSGGSCLSTRG